MGAESSRPRSRHIGSIFHHPDGTMSLGSTWTHPTYYERLRYAAQTAAGGALRYGWIANRAQSGFGTYVPQRVEAPQSVQEAAKRYTGDWDSGATVHRYYPPRHVPHQTKSSQAQTLITGPYYAARQQTPRNF